MIDISTATVNQYSPVFRSEFSFYRPRPASTVLNVEELMERIHLEESSYTYRVKVVEPMPKPIRSFTITVPLILRGKGKRHPLDDDIVNFDE